MSKITRNIKFAKIRAAAMIALAAGGALATSVGMDAGPSGLTWFQRTVVDFNTNPKLGWRTMPDGRKYLGFGITGTGGCYEMLTYSVTSPAVGDTKIHFKKGSEADASYKLLNDNVGTSKFSKARFWFEQKAGTSGEQMNLTITAATTAFNTMSFGYYVYLVPGKTSTSCNDGVTAYVKYVGGVVTLTYR